MYLFGTPGTPRGGGNVVQQGSASATEKWGVRDDYLYHEAQHVTLTPNTDTAISFAQEVELIFVTNWSTTGRVLAKFAVITSNTDASAARVGLAPASDIPNDKPFIRRTTSIHIRSAVAAEVTVEGYGR